MNRYYIHFRAMFVFSKCQVFVIVTLLSIFLSAKGEILIETYHLFIKINLEISL